MNISTQALPTGYIQTGEVNLKKNVKLAIVLNIAALFITILVFFLLTSMAAWLRPGLLDIEGSITIGRMIGLLGMVVILLITHELIHGFFFWVFSHSKPVFALRLLYAYAGAPGWYFPRLQYVITALGPLVIIGAVGLLLILLVPTTWVLMITFLVAFNTGGAAGDIFVFFKLLTVSPTSFVHDTGDVVTFFERPMLESGKMPAA